MKIVIGAIVAGRDLQKLTNRNKDALKYGKDGQPFTTKEGDDPNWGTETKEKWLGYPILVQGENGGYAKNIEGTAINLSAVPVRYAREVERAQKRWDKFVAWVKVNHDVTLPKGELILVAE
jgi:hypothetical protein